MRLGRPAMLGVWLAVWAVMGGQVRGAEPSADATEAEIAAAWGKAGEPTRVSLKLENVTPSEAYQKLVAAAGWVIGVPKDTLRRPKLVTLTVENEPFWQVMEKLSAQAPVEFEVDGAGAPRLQWRSQSVSPFVVTVGPARIRLTRFDMGASAKQDLDYEGAEVERDPLAASLAFHVDVEPRLLVKQCEIELTSVVEATGQDLIQRAPPAGGERRTWSWARDAGADRAFITDYLSVAIPEPSREAPALRLVCGMLRLTLPSDPPRLRCAIPCVPPVAVRCGPQTVTFERVEQVAGGDWAVTLSLAPPVNSSEYLRLFRGIRLVTADGQMLAPTQRSAGQQRGQPPRFECQFGGSAKRQVVAVTVPVPVAAQVKEFAFEFHDVPLPPRTSCYQGKRATETVVVPAPAPIAAPPGVRPLEELAPSTYTRQGADVPLAELLKDLTAQTANRIDVSWDRRGDGEPVMVKAAFVKTPFREVLDRLGELPRVEISPGISQAPSVTMVVRSPGTVRAKLRRSAFVHDVGMFRLAAGRVAVWATCRMEYGADQHQVTDELTLNLGVGGYGEPRLKVVSSGMSIEECRANDGRDLLAGLPERSDRPEDRYTDDPRGTHLTSTSEWPYAGVNPTYWLKDRLLPARLARVRCYFLVRPREGEKELTVTDVTHPSVQPIDESSTLKWNGLVADAAGPTLEFKVAGTGGPYPPLDVRWINQPAWPVTCFNADGGQISSRLERRLDDNGWRLSFPEAALPAKVVLKCPTGARQHAGVVEFHDLPVPELQ